MLSALVAVACLIWTIAVILVCFVGYLQIWRYYRAPPQRAVCETSLRDDDIPHVTVIRPVKGLEPCLYECLASTFHQTYPPDKITVFFCVASRQDPSFPTLQKVIRDFASFDAKILVQDEDPLSGHLGPNPKIRNMSRAYREAKGDIVWIIDCNVWVAKGVLGRMVDKLCGFSNGEPAMPYKFVHQLPLVVDVTDSQMSNQQQDHGRESDSVVVASTSTASTTTLPTSHSRSSSSLINRWLALAGGRLEEAFLASAHAKFYTAINTVLIAPCIVGKSNMFRRSHLDELTARQSHDLNLPTPTSGLDYFSNNICEDHLIGDLLWKKPLLSELRHNEERLGSAQKWGKHALLFGDPAIQPMASMSVREYCARRARWLRVRKFTVTLATLVEPGTESFLCSVYAVWALMSLPIFQSSLGIPQTPTAFALTWLAMVSAWCIVDWTLYRLLHSLLSVEADSHTPPFAHPHRISRHRPFSQWLPSWLAREVLTLPIWTWAVYGGTTVVWRGQKFRVGLDMRVHAMPSSVASASVSPEAAEGSSSGRGVMNGFTSTSASSVGIAAAKAKARVE